MNKAVVVTGMGIVSSLDSGRGLDIFWEKALNGEDGIRRITIF